MVKTKYIGLILVLLFSAASVAQKRKLEAAGKQFDKYAYQNAINTYEGIADKGHKSANLFQRLGDAYYFNSRFDKAARYYGELFALNEEVVPEYYYRYAQSLKANGDYAKADEMMEQFSAKKAADLRGDLYEQNKNYLKEIEKNSGRYTINKTNINSPKSDYGPAYYGNELVFTSNRDSTGIMKYVDAWTNQSFTVLYKAPLTGGNPGKAKRFEDKIQTKFHEATPAFTKDKKTMYFTRNNYNNGKVQTDSKGRILLKIYRAKLIKGHWDEVTELPFNKNTHSTAHPALSPDEKTLYFASDMPGSFGDTDIYKVAINADGTFGTPVNLGYGLNTEGKETFPFAAEGKLYFASDGHPGLGGLDIYVAPLEKDGNYKKAYNVGEPINSKTDDFGFIINPADATGFFCSNRKGGEGFDDIYGFREDRKLEFECSQLLTGVVTDAKTGDIFSNAKVSLYDANRNLIKEGVTDAAGLYTFDVECGKIYYVKAEKENYFPKEETITVSVESGVTQLPIAQEKPEPVVVKTPEPKIKVGTDLAKEFGIKEIYFDLGKYNIRPDAALQLEKIINFMKEYPTAKIDIRSHTDCRASHKYNETLSDNRAKSIREYLVKSGIDAGRLTGRGYGETQLVNKCADGVKCSEEEHQQNRRSEFIIMEI